MTIYLLYYSFCLAKQDRCNFVCGVDACDSSALRRNECSFKENNDVKNQLWLMLFIFYFY